VNFWKLKRLALSVPVLALGVCSVTVAAPTPSPWPPHAHIVARGWECDRGYEERSGLCLPIEVPQHAHLTARGHDWQCDKGFRLLEETCVVPIS
jgi:hypothetical protein